MAVASYRVLREYDEKLRAEGLSGEAAVKLLEEANEKIAGMTKEKTTDVLGKVLYEVSCLMKNGFSRSDA